MKKLITLAISILSLNVSLSQDKANEFLNLKFDITKVESAFNTFIEKNLAEIEYEDYLYEKYTNQFGLKNFYYEADIDDIDVIEMEEEVTFNFDTKAYLPKDFNPLKGIGDLDWNTIELAEVEEEEEEVNYTTETDLNLKTKKQTINYVNN